MELSHMYLYDSTLFKTKLLRDTMSMVHFSDISTNYQRTEISNLFEDLRNAGFNYIIEMPDLFKFRLNTL